MICQELLGNNDGNASIVSQEVTVIDTGSRDHPTENPEIEDPLMLIAVSLLKAHKIVCRRKLHQVRGDSKMALEGGFVRVGRDGVGIPGTDRGRGSERGIARPSVGGFGLGVRGMLTNGVLEPRGSSQRRENCRRRKSGPDHRLSGGLDDCPGTT